jgi:hypothetical protein
MGQRGKIIEVAKSQLGYTEGPNNDTKYGEWYGMNNQPWCAMFVSWCAWMAGISTDIVPKFASCTQGFRQMQEMGIATNDKITPKPGDLIFFDWDLSGDKDHVGLVEYVENGIVHTIEGNHSNKVERFHYPVDYKYIAGYGCPRYDDEPTPVPKDEKVLQIQKWVNTYGFGIAEDGEDGPETRCGVTKAYQTELNRQFDAGLDVDGDFGNCTYKASPNVYPGAKGPITMSIQCMLYLKGYDIKWLDGDYGSNTEEQTKRFQSNNYIRPVDGVYGKNMGLQLFN